MEQEYPIPAVDIVIEYNDGVVLIERESGKWALPGGFIELGETAEEAAVREAKEETNLEIGLKGLLGVYSDPKRDPRGHILSITFLAIGEGELQAGSDAANAVVLPVEEALEKELAFDHRRILEQYRELTTL